MTNEQIYVFNFCNRSYYDRFELYVLYWKANYIIGQLSNINLTIT
jgi:hypothetical protein